MLADRGRTEYLPEVFREIGERHWFEFDTVGTVGDHAHLFLGAAPRYAPAKIAKIVQSITAREMFRRFPEIRKRLWGGVFWEDGYFVRSVGEEVTEEVIREYIREYIKKQDQDSHHAPFEQMMLFEF